MKVKNRSQITEVVTRRSIFHSLEYQGKRYSRIMQAKTEIPFMDENIIVHKPKLEWRQLIDNVLHEISKELVKELETAYQALPIREKNGDI